MANDKLPSYGDVEKEPVNPDDALGNLEKNAGRSGSLPANVLKHSKDADEAMKAFEGHEGEVLVLDEATNRRLLRKIDWNIMPVCQRYIRQVHQEAHLCSSCALSTASTTLTVCRPSFHRFCLLIVDRNHPLLCQRDGHQERHQPERRRLPMARQHVLLWYALFSPLSRLMLISPRIPGLGIPHQSPSPTASSRQIFLFLYHNVGSSTLLHGSCPELLWRHRRSLLPGCL